MNHLMENMEDHEKAHDERRREAAQRIQRLWRKKNTAKAKCMHLNADQRWSDAAMHAKMKVGRMAAERGDNKSRDRWRRGVFFANRLQDGNFTLDGADLQPEENAQLEKHLETQHWLELIDGKHRYGSNLKWYHRAWQNEDTTENFFKWLDQGGGKNLTLDECSREQLEKESQRIIYLSAEQRLNYLVKIDEEGKLRWAKNNEFVDTAAGHWKDAGDGSGIVPQDGSEVEDTPRRRDSFNSVSPESSITSEQDNAATHYVGSNEGKTRLSRLLRRHFTLNGLLDRLLRKTVRRNTWIYVSDKHSNLFVGIKVTGTFQHSSFLAGGLVTSAGLISVKQGVIRTLSPLSGHYRTSINQFHQFIDMLRQRNVDLSKTSISKAEVVLWGIEHIAKAKKAKGKVVKTGKTKAKDAARKVAAVMTPSGMDGDNQTWKKEILQGHRPKDSNVAEGGDERAAAVEEVTGQTPIEPADHKHGIAAEAQSKVADPKTAVNAGPRETGAFEAVPER